MEDLINDFVKIKISTENSYIYDKWYKWTDKSLDIPFTPLKI